MAHVVGNRACAGLVGRNVGRRGAVVRLRSVAAAMNAVAQQVCEPGRVQLFDNVRPHLDSSPSENSARLLVLHTWIQTRRLLTRWSHDIQTLLQALILPPMFLASINLVFGKLVSAVSGHSALYGSVPMAALVGAV